MGKEGVVEPGLGDAHYLLVFVFKNENHDKLLKTGLAEGGFVDLDEIKQYYFTDLRCVQ